MEKQGWENIYRLQGEVQSEVLQVVKNATELFKEKGYLYSRFSAAKVTNVEYILLIGDGIHTIKGFLIEAIK